MFADEVLKILDQGCRFPACSAHGRPSSHFDVPTFRLSSTPVPAMRFASPGSSPGAQSAVITSAGDLGMEGVAPATKMTDTNGEFEISGKIEKWGEFLRR